VRSIKWLFIFLAVSVFIGCALPIGFIGENGAGTDGKLVAVPYRIVYRINNDFKRDDVGVFISSGGELHSISDENNLKISVIQTPEYTDVKKEVPDDGYKLQYRGRYDIVIEYKNLDPALYSIEVQDPDNVGGEPDIPGTIHMGNGGIIWVY